MVHSNGAAFDQPYNGSLFYVIWNDRFYDDPPIEATRRGRAPATAGHEPNRP